MDGAFATCEAGGVCLDACCLADHLCTAFTAQGEPRCSVRSALKTPPISCFTILRPDGGSHEGRPCRPTAIFSCITTMPRHNGASGMPLPKPWFGTMLLSRPVGETTVIIQTFRALGHSDLHIEWIVDGLLSPGGWTFLVGEAGSGKSMLMVQ